MALTHRDKPQMRKSKKGKRKQSANQRSTQLPREFCASKEVTDYLYAENRKFQTTILQSKITQENDCPSCVAVLKKKPSILLPCPIHLPSKTVITDSILENENVHRTGIIIQ